MGDFDNLKAGYLGYVDRALGLVPYGRAKIWKEFFLNPLPTLRKDDVGILARMKDMAAMMTVSAVIECIIYLPILAITALLTFGAGIMPALLLLMLVAASIVIAPIMAFLYSLLELVVAKVLGGKGTMRSNYNASALPGLGMWAITLPITVAMIPLGWLSMVPFVSICTLIITLPLSLLMLGLWVYSLYLKYLSMREVHKVSSARAAGIVVVPFLAIAAVIAVAFIALYLYIMASVLAMTGAMGAAGGAVPLKP
jgi:hypothetical protein